MKQRKWIPIGVLICLLLFSTGTTGQEKAESQDKSMPTSFQDTTFIIGTLISPAEINGTVSAKALHLFYYDPGFFVDNIGFVRGFTTIRFEPKPFFYTYSPGPFGFIKYVMGFCTNFEIIEGCEY